MKLRLLAVAMTALTLTAGSAFAQDTNSDKGKLSYALGYQLGREAAESGEALDLATMTKALQDGYAKKDPAVPMDQMRTAYQGMQQRLQTKAKAAYDKGAELAAEATEFAKGNVEALVESGKIYAAGVQELSKGYVEEAKSAYETFTADLKELAAVKSPAELFQLQAKLARRNFDALVAYGSKNADAVTKLASEAFAPISGRISLAAETIAKAA